MPPSRRKIATAVALLLLLALAVWLLSQSASGPADPTSAASSELSADPTWALDQLPSVAPEFPTLEGNPATPTLTDAPEPGQPSLNHPPMEGEGSPVSGNGSADTPHVPVLTQKLRSEKTSPGETEGVVAEASPEDLLDYLRAAAKLAPPQLRDLFSNLGPDSPRAQLEHTVLFNEALALRRSLRSRYPKRLPAAEAAALAALNLAVARRGLNQPGAKKAIEAEIATELAKKAPPRKTLDRLFSAAKAELARVTTPDAPPADPRALAVEQARAFYRVQLLAALRLKHGTGHAVPGMPRLTPEASQSGLKGKLGQQGGR